MDAPIHIKILAVIAWWFLIQGYFFTTKSNSSIDLYHLNKKLIGKYYQKIMQINLYLAIPTCVLMIAFCLHSQLYGGAFLCLMFGAFIGCCIWRIQWILKKSSDSGMRAIELKKYYLKGFKINLIITGSLLLVFFDEKSRHHAWIILIGMSHIILLNYLIYKFLNKIEFRKQNTNSN